MSKIWISEFSDIGSDSRGNPVPISLYPAITRQTPLTLGATQLSAAFNKSTKYVELRSDAICHYVVGWPGESPTATVNDTPLDANTAKFIGVPAGGKLAVIVGA